MLFDSLPSRGPSSGLLEASRAYPDVAWLAVAVDLAYLDSATVAALVAGRNFRAAATAFRHPDETVEPLCTIWEPLACRALADRVAREDLSPRRCLESLELAIVECPSERALVSVDSPRERAAVLAQLENSR